ncbi:MAG: tRNA preQ1(34) S-adenosylmethionine ribosyltransferase-isomerase QueA [Candidatus Methylacidiphilales bacterium]
MKTSEFHFDLPEQLIAARPTDRRDGSRLMVVERASGRIETVPFPEIGRWLGEGDLLVLNDSRVIHARLIQPNPKTELLLLEQTSPGHWLAIGKPAKRILPGTRLQFPARRHGFGPLEAQILRTLPDGSRVVRFPENMNLALYGEMPLPPYIIEARQRLGLPAQLPEDEDRYQTVYARQEGSVAAPTAGLHFTPELLGQFDHAFITLHVGLGTFRPVKVAEIEDHEMHEERFFVPEGLRERAAAARRVVAVGTTTARVLESVPDLRPGPGRTRMFIRPPYQPKRTDVLLTNFHLPGSTLLMLVAAFTGLELQREAYRRAVAERFRFFSYGDAMLIV